MELAVVKKYLSDHRIVYTDKDDETVRAIYRDDGARYGDAFAIYLSAKPTLLKAVVSSDFRVTVAARRHIAQFIAEYNWTLQEGCAEMDVRDGELRFRLSVPLTGATPDLVTKLVELSLSKCSVWSKLANAVHDYASQTSGGSIDDAKLKYYLSQATA